MYNVLYLNVKYEVKSWFLFLLRKKKNNNNNIILVIICRISEHSKYNETKKKNVLVQIVSKTNIIKNVFVIRFLLEVFIIIVHVDETFVLKFTQIQ